MDTRADAGKRAKEWIDIGSAVIDSQGKDVGTVGYVVVQPPEMHMTDVVVNTGSLLGRDIVVPTSKVDSIKDGQIYLSIDRQALETFPDYVELHYQRPPADWTPTPFMYFSAEAVLWPAGSYYPEPASLQVNAPSGSVAFQKGMEVQSRDGHKIGTIESVDEDPTSGNICDVIVKQGLLLPHDTQMSIDLVARVETDRVILKLTKDEIEQRLKDKEAAGFRTL